jgi:hypothetical protein
MVNNTAWPSWSRYEEEAEFDGVGGAVLLPKTLRLVLMPPTALTGAKGGLGVALAEVSELLKGTTFATGFAGQQVLMVSHKWGDEGALCWIQCRTDCRCCWAELLDSTAKRNRSWARFSIKVYFFAECVRRGVYVLVCAIFCCAL